MSAAAEVIQNPTNLNHPANTARYARVISASKRVRWDIDRDVVRGRQFDLTRRQGDRGQPRAPRRT